jgi:hypothetical protein
MDSTDVGATQGAATGGLEAPERTNALPASSKPVLVDEKCLAPRRDEVRFPQPVCEAIADDLSTAGALCPGGTRFVFNACNTCGCVDDLRASDLLDDSAWEVLDRSLPYLVLDPIRIDVYTPR